MWSSAVPMIQTACDIKSCLRQWWKCHFSLVALCLILRKLFGRLGLERGIHMVHHIFKPWSHICQTKSELDCCLQLCWFDCEVYVCFNLKYCTCISIFVILNSWLSFLYSMYCSVIADMKLIPRTCSFFLLSKLPAHCLHWYSKWSKILMNKACRLAAFSRAIVLGAFQKPLSALNLRVLKISTLYEKHIFQCMGKIFCVEFQSTLWNSTPNI